MKQIILFTFICYSLLSTLNCASTHYNVFDQIQVKDKTVLISAESKKRSKLQILYKKKFIKINAKHSIIENFASQANQAGIRVVSSFYLPDNSIALITKENGIYVIPNRLINPHERSKVDKVKTNTDAIVSETTKAESKDEDNAISEEDINQKTDILYLSENKKQLRSTNINDIYLRIEGKVKKLYITYKGGIGKGITICPLLFIGEVNCEQWTTSNTDLKSNFVSEVISDTLGNLWVRYDSSEELGVSRINKDLSWSHFDENNSELGSSSVYFMAIEKENQGLAKNNIWFVSTAGLTRLTNDSSQTWKLYGNRQNAVTTMAKVVGIESWFTNAIVNIKSLIILKKSILISNEEAVYQLSEKGINRYKPKNIGGLDKNIIDSVYHYRGKLMLTLKATKDNHPYISSMQSFDIKKRKWKKINYWKFRKNFAENILISAYENKYYLMTYRYRFLASAIVFYNMKSQKFSKILKTNGYKK